MRWRPVLLAALPVLLLMTTVWLGSDRPSCVPIEPTQTAECTEAECGPPPACPVYECPDGSLGGCTGICFRNDAGDCAWEVRDCPDPCAGIPECDLACPPGTHNPIDDNGCVHSCDCVPDEDPCAHIPVCDFLCPPGTHNPIDDNGCVHWCECTPDEDPCANIPVCDRACPPGTHNPIDDNGCVLWCECVPDDPELQWYETCGDPVCHGWGDAGLPACTTERIGAPCHPAGAMCDPRNMCNSHVLCTTEDPRLQPGGCPISRRETKKEIHYLTSTERDGVRDEILGFRLATYRYRAAPERQHLGFIIEDQEPSVAIDSGRDMVDLYGYTSMVVATLQSQAEQINALRREIAALRVRLGD